MKREIHIGQSSADSPPGADRATDALSIVMQTRPYLKLNTYLRILSQSSQPPWMAGMQILQEQKSAKSATSSAAEFAKTAM
jgi:hypothetical protein